MSLIEPHGGRLIDREARGAERESLLRASAHMPELTLNAREEADLELIATGALSPLEGFMGEADYVLVRDQRRLASGSVWTIPVTLSVTEDEKAKLKIGDDVALRSRDGRLLAVLHLAEIFKYDKQLEAERVYLTTEDKHPGVKALYEQGDYLLGGHVSVVERRGVPDAEPRAPRPRIHPEMRARNCRRIVAPSDSGRDEIRRHPGRGPAARLRSDHRALLPAIANAARSAARRDALRRAAGGHLPRHHPAELRMLALHRGARSSGRRQLLRHLRLATHLRPFRAGRVEDRADVLRQHVLLPQVRRDGVAQDLPTRPVAPRKHERHARARDAFAGRDSAGRIHAARSRAGSDRGAARVERGGMRGLRIADCGLRIDSRRTVVCKRRRNKSWIFGINKSAIHNPQ